MKKSTNISSRIGITCKMNNGMNATCIRYEAAHDIDIEFEDGYIATNKTWKNFINGNIANPNIKYTDYRTRNGRNAKSDYLNRTYKLNSAEVKISKYNNYDNVIVIDKNGIEFSTSMDILLKRRSGSSGKTKKINQENIPFKGDRLNETKIMNCGLSATIIAYRGYKDIDVQFEDGSVSTHKSYSKFKKGQISNNKKSNEICKKERIGLSKTMNDGSVATIVSYRTAHDIDVQFEDGTISYHKRYGDFLKGGIANPSIKKIENGHIELEKVLEKRLGETKTMNCGMSATIIEYRNSHDIDVRFEDGTIVKNKEYRSFKNNNIKNPSLLKRKNGIKAPKIERPDIPSFEKTQRLGQKAIMNNGLSATIIRYKNAKDMDIEWENGIVTRGVYYKCFTDGAIGCKEGQGKKGKRPTIKKERVGERKIMNCGMYATIISYVNCENLDIQFDDGFIVKNVTYQSFCKGRVYNPNTYGALGISRNEFALQKILKPYGFKKAEQGSLYEIGFGRAELDLYNPNLNGYKVAIEYDGGSTYKGRGHTVSRDKKKNKKCKEAGIVLIRIREPQLPKLNDSSIDFFLTTAEILSRNFIDTITEVIGYINNTFKTCIPEKIECNREEILTEFKENYIGQNNENYYRKNAPIYKSRFSQNLENVRISEVNTMNCGMDAMIIAYRNRDDMDIEFEDGNIREHVRYSAFKKGQIAHPTLKTTYKAS